MNSIVQAGHGTDSAHDPAVGETNPTKILSALAALGTIPMASTGDQIKLYLSMLCQLIGVRTAFVTHLTKDAMYVLDVRNLDGCPISPKTRIPLEDSFCQYVRASGTPLVIPDTGDDVRVMNLPTRTQLRIGAYLGVPLLLRNGTLQGTLCAVDPSPRPFTQEQIDLARIIASYIAQCINREDLPGEPQPADSSAQDIRAALEEQSYFLRMIVHDLRSPLMGVAGYIELISNGSFGGLVAPQAAALAQVQKAAQFMNRLVNDLHDAAVSESQTLTFLTELIDPNQLAREMLELCHGQAVAKGLCLRLVPSDSAIQMVGDPDRLRQILLNLLNNAVRYTEEGMIRLRVVAAAKMVEFYIEDTGPGIAPEALDQIWQRYTRLSTRGDGLGLGLYVVRRLAEGMGGMAGVRSTPGEGSVFWVRLPMQRSQPRKIAWT